MSSFGTFDSGGLSGGGVISINFAVTGAVEAAAEIDTVTASEVELEAASRRGAMAHRVWSRAARESAFSAGFLGKGLSMLAKWGKRGALALGISGALLLANGMRFEQQMATVAAVTGAHGKQLQGLSNLAMRESTRSQFSATQAANAEMLLGRASFKTNQIMRLLPATLNLATAAQGNLQETTTLMGETLLAFDLSASKGAHVADVLADATRNGAMSMDDIVQAMKYVGAAAYGSHQPLEDIVGLMKLMALHGVKGSLAGTTLRYALTRLVKPVKQVEDGLKLINMHASDLYGPHGLKPLPDILSVMYDRMKAIGAVNRQKVLVDVFGVRALSGMNALFNQGPKAWNAAIKRMKTTKGEAAEIARIMNNTVPRQFQMVLHAIENVGTTIYLSFQPAVLGYLKTINKAFDPVMKHIGQIQALIKAGNYHDAIIYVDELMNAHGRLASILFTVGDSFREAWRTLRVLWKILKPTVVILAVGLFFALRGVNRLLKLFNDHAKVLIPYLRIVVGLYVGWKVATLALAAAQWLFNIAADAFPLFAIAAIIYGLYELYEHSDKFRKIIDTIWHFIRDHWVLLGAILIGPVLLAVRFIVTHWNGIVSMYEAFPGKMKQIGARMWDWMKKPFKDVIDWLWKYFKPLYDKIMFVRNLVPDVKAGKKISNSDPSSPIGRYGTAGAIFGPNAVLGGTHFAPQANQWGSGAMQTTTPTASFGHLPPKKTEPWHNPLQSDGFNPGDDRPQVIQLLVDGKKLAEVNAKAKSDKTARGSGKRSALDQLQSGSLGG